MALALWEGKILVSIARDAVDSAVRGDEPSVRTSMPGTEGQFLNAKRGAFVTLTDGEEKLRGCIGIPYPVKPLGEAVFEAAVGAATRDPRFQRVEPQELDTLTVEVSALTQPEELKVRPADLPKHVRIGTDGLIVSGMGTSGLLLPQVATEYEASPETFLSMTCEKAGLFPDSWLRGNLVVRRFQAEVFTEMTPRGAVGELKGTSLLR